MQAGAFDAVVVGGGHNGLTAACYLAKAGRRVVVVERGSKVGGMTHSDHLIPTAPQHMVNTCAVEAISLRTTSIVKDLDLARHGWRTVDPDPTYVYLHPDGTSLAFWRDPAKTAEEIGAYSPNDAKAYLEFMKLLDALYGIAMPLMGTSASKPSFSALLQSVRTLIRYWGLRGELLALVLGTSDQAALERFEHPVTIAALLNIVSGAGAINEDGGGLTYVLLALFHRAGVGRPIGGMQALPNALNARFVELGGKVLTGVAVEEVLVEGGQTHGVRLADGQIIEARAVIVTCDPRTAYHLVTPGAIEPRFIRRVEHAPYNRANASPLMVHLALSGQIRPKEIYYSKRRDGLDLRVPVALLGTAEDVRESFAAAQRGDYAASPSIWMATPSAWDPTQAPDGQDVAYLYPPAMPAVPRDTSQTAIDNGAAAVVRQVGKFFDGLDQELGRWVETPQDRARRLNVTNGCITHIDFALLRSGSMRPAAGLGADKAFPPGIFLGGAGAHPGGGVSGLPGKLAAERVGKFLK
jgi:phytoene dehydrogenase-like protein